MDDDLDERELMLAKAREALADYEQNKRELEARRAQQWMDEEWREARSKPRGVQKPSVTLSEPESRRDETGFNWASVDKRITDTVDSLEQAVVKTFEASGEAFAYVSKDMEAAMSRLDAVEARLSQIERRLEQLSAEADFGGRSAEIIDLKIAKGDDDAA